MLSVLPLTIPAWALSGHQAIANSQEGLDREDVVSGTGQGGRAQPRGQRLGRSEVLLWRLLMGRGQHTALFTSFPHLPDSLSLLGP